MSEFSENKSRKTSDATRKVSNVIINISNLSNKASPSGSVVKPKRIIKAKDSRSSSFESLTIQQVTKDRLKTRTDKFGNIILKGGKEHKVSFKEKGFVKVIEIENLKECNVADKLPNSQLKPLRAQCQCACVSF